MSLLDEWLLEPTDIPFEKSAAFLVELQQPTMPAPLPPKTAAVQAGLLKIAALTFSRGVDALPEIERQAMVDPNVAAALEYEQAKAENAELQQQLEASQAQLAMATQQQQMTEQQLMEAQQAQEQMQAQVEEAAQGQQMAQQQAVEAQQASLAERVQSIEQREQLAQAATEMKANLEQLAEGLGQLRGQAAGAPPEQQGEPLPEPDPTAPADVQKEQEQAQKAELEAEQQKAQAGLAEEQEAVQQQAAAQPPEEMGEVPPAPEMEQMEGAAGPGGPVAGAPQIPTPAGGALPKTSSAKLAAGSTNVQLPMGQYPKPPKQSVLAGAASMKLPAVGRVIPQLKRLTEDSSKLEGTVDPEQLKEEPQPETGKKADPALQEKQASMWKQASANDWLFKLGQEETVAETPVAELAEQLKELDTGQLEQLLSSLSKEGMGQLGTSIAEGAIRGGVIGAGVGGITRGAQAYREGADSPPGQREQNAIREAAKGAVMGAAIGAAAGGIGGATTLRAQDMAVAGAPRFHPQTGAQIPEAARQHIAGEMARGVVASRAHPAGVIGGLVGGSKGPEMVDRMMGKSGSAHLHPRLAKFATRNPGPEGENLEQFKQRVTESAVGRAGRRGQARGVHVGLPLGQLTGAALGFGGTRLLGGSPRAQLMGTALGALGGGAVGGFGGAHLGKKRGEEQSRKVLDTIAPEHWKADHEVSQARKSYARGEEGAKERYADAIRRRAAAADISRDNVRTAYGRGQI